MGSSTFYERLLSKKGQDESLRAFAERIGASLSSLHRWAAGSVPARPEELVRIAYRLEVSPSWLTFGHEAVPPDESRIRE